MKKIITILIFALTLSSCKVETNFTHKGIDDIAGVYKVFMGKIDSLNIYIVDGELVRKEIYPDFIFGGNEQRYPYVPHNEIWIDNSIPNREYTTTLKHEINEMNLMRDFEWTYIQAHDSSLMLEVKMRNEFKNESESHEKNLDSVSVTDTDDTKEIPGIPNKVKLKNIYLQKIEDKNTKYNIWLVDGDKIRRDIYPDFGFNGDWNDYNFVPENEIWIDGSISCELYIYSILEEKSYIEFLDTDLEYAEIVKKTTQQVSSFRGKMFNDLAGKFVKIDRNNLARDKGKK